jgi:hypothetical protein
VAALDARFAHEPIRARGRGEDMSISPPAVLAVALGLFVAYYSQGSSFWYQILKRIRIAATAGPQADAAVA